MQVLLWYAVHLRYRFRTCFLFFLQPVPHTFPRPFYFLLPAHSNRYFFPALFFLLFSDDISYINYIYRIISFLCFKLSTTTSSGGLILALQRAITTARPEGRYRKHCYWLRYKAVLLESSLLESSRPKSFVPFALQLWMSVVNH